MLQSKAIEQTVNSFRTDYVFTFRDLGLPPEYSANAIRKLNRMAVNDNVKVYQKIIQKYTTSTECCKGTKSLLYITYC